MSRNSTFAVSAESTCSPESEDGNSPCVSPDGRPTVKSGREAAPASRSRKRAGAKRKKTRAISGPKCSGSFASDALNTSLANKFRELFDTVGSMEYVQTWKERVTPAGRLYWEHTARGRRTSDSESGGEPSGYPTPMGSERDQTPKQFVRGNPNLAALAILSGYPSPDAVRRGGAHKPEQALRRMARKGKQKHQSNLQDVAVLSLSGYATPKSTDGEKGGPNQTGCTLPEQSHMVLTGFATPNTVDAKGGNRNGEGQDQLCFQALGAISTSSHSEMGNSAALNPELARWLMGFPPEQSQSSPGYWSWVLMQKLLGGLSVQQSDIELAASEAMATQL
jgi:hypothetical protein